MSSRYEFSSIKEVNALEGGAFFDGVPLEDAFDLLVEDWVLYMDARGLILFSNQSAASALCFRKEANEPIDLLGMLEPASRIEMISCIQQLKGDEIWRSKTLYFALSNGGRVGKRLFITKSPFGFFITDTDIYELEKSITQTGEEVQNLRERGNDFVGLLEGSPNHLVAKFTLDGRFISCSKNCKALLGYDVDELAGRSGYDFIYNEDVTIVEDAHARILQGEDVGIVFRRVHKNGGVVYTQCAAALFESNAKEKQSFILDVETVVSLDHVESLSNTWKQLVQELSLQLRDPQKRLNLYLNRALSCAKELMQWVSHAEKDLIKPIYIACQEVGYLQSIYEDLTLFKSFHSDFVLDNRKRIAFNPTVKMQEYVSCVLTQWGEFKIDVSSDIDVIDEDVLGYPDLLFGRVFHNLISNARKALLQVKRNRVLKLEMKEIFRDEQKINLRFSVFDNGCGIPRRYLTKVFEAYLQIVKTCGSKGMGLGLYNVKKLIESMGGTITIDSKEGEFTQVSFTLTFYKAAKTLSFTPDESSQKPLVACVDDNSSQNFIMKSMATSLFDIEVDVFSDGSEVIEAFSLGKRYDAYVVDYEMPIIGGAELIRKLRKRGVNSYIVGFSGVVGMGVYEKFKEAGADQVYTKPFSIKKILEDVVSFTRV